MNASDAVALQVTIQALEKRRHSRELMAQELEEHHMPSMADAYWAAADQDGEKIERLKSQLQAEREVPHG